MSKPNGVEFDECLTLEEKKMVSIPRLNETETVNPAKIYIDFFNLFLIQPNSNQNLPLYFLKKKKKEKRKKKSLVAEHGVAHARRECVARRGRVACSRDRAALTLILPLIS